MKSPKFLDEKFDLIVGNPPFSIAWEENKEDKRFNDFSVVPPKSKADFAFLMHMIYMLSDDGVCVTLGFPGILYRKAREGKIRKEFVEKGLIKRVVQIPEGYFEDTNISTVLLVLSKKKEDYIIFGDLKLKKERKVKFEEIKENDFNLSVSTYIEEEREDPFANFEIEESFDELDGLMINRFEKDLDYRLLALNIFGDYSFEEFKKLINKLKKIIKEKENIVDSQLSGIEQLKFLQI